MESVVLLSKLQVLLSAYKLILMPTLGSLGSSYVDIAATLMSPPSNEPAAAVPKTVLAL